MEAGSAPKHSNLPRKTHDTPYPEENGLCFTKISFFVRVGILPARIENRYEKHDPMAGPPAPHPIYTRLSSRIMHGRATSSRSGNPRGTRSYGSIFSSGKVGSDDPLRNHRRTDTSTNGRTTSRTPSQRECQRLGHRSGSFPPLPFPRAGYGAVRH